MKWDRALSRVNFIGKGIGEKSSENVYTRGLHIF